MNFSDGSLGFKSAINADWISQARRTSVSRRVVTTLSSGWQHASTSPHLAATPSDLDEGFWDDWAGTTANGDAYDHWFRCVVSLDSTAQRTTLVFEGIATIAQVWCDGDLVGTSMSMFTPLVVDLSGFAQRADSRDVSLVVVCRSLDQHVAQLKVPRARWKTRLVAEQKLRAVRTTLMGRIPSWTPDVTVVGMWRPISLVEERGVLIDDVRVERGVDSITVRVLSTDERSEGWALSAQLGPCSGEVYRSGEPGEIAATFDTSVLTQWMPHTHGSPHRHALMLILTDAAGHSDLSSKATETVIDLGLVSVRTARIETGPDGDGFGLVMNDVPMFCRGGALMPLDVATLHDDVDQMRTMLALLCRAGVNMVRISGTTAPVSAEVLDLCDELGVLVWLDLPFANFDYPSTEDFLGEATREVASILNQRSRSAAIVVVCGGSEIEQQAAMMGVSQEVIGANALLDALQETVAAFANVAWVRSSPTGGHLPFSVDTGVAHYFGVGAYGQPLNDARHSGVRFAAECLAFANVPSPRMIAEILPDGRSAPTDPRWKAGVPRDRGVGWDFEDVRDHYARVLFGVDPKELARTDPGYYLAIGRAVSYEVFARTFGEWRRSSSTCNGGLVWFLNDLVKGAGWGVVDARSQPKAALHGMARSLSRVAIAPIDEGVNGLDWWIFNDGPTQLEAVLQLSTWRHGGLPGEQSSVTVSVGPYSSHVVRHDAVMGRFTDPTYIYQFGEPQAEVYAGQLLDGGGAVLSEASFVPQGRPIDRQSDLGLRVAAQRVSDELINLTLDADRLCRAVNIDVSHGLVWPNMVDVFPDRPRSVIIEACRPGPLSGSADALNGKLPTYFSVSS